MKKVFLSILLVVVVFSIVGCDLDTTGNNNSDNHKIYDQDNIGAAINEGLSQAFDDSGLDHLAGETANLLVGDNITGQDYTE